MARFFRRRFRNRRRIFRRPFRRTRRFTKRVKRVERRVQRIASSIETKTVTNTCGAFITVDDTGRTLGANQSTTPTWLNAPLQGIGFNNRIGLDIRCTKLYFSYFTKPSATTTGNDAFNTMRILIVKWKSFPPTSAVVIAVPPSLAFVLQSTTYPESLVSPYNWAYRQHFRVLYDSYRQSGTVDAAEYTGVAESRPPIKVMKKLNIQTHFSTSSQYDIERNGICGYAISDSTVSPHPEIFWMARVNYQDA